MRTFAKHVERHVELPSTNDRALVLAADPDLPTPAIVLAERQTAGRGRGANRWWSDDGALTFSLIVEPSRWQLTSDRWPQLSLAAAVAICETLLQFAPGFCVGLKWPNDVHVEGRKIAGVLVEIPNVPALPARRVVVGVGLNVNNSWRSAPDELRDVGTSLVDLTGGPHDVNDVLAVLLGRIDHVLQQLGDEDPALPARWQSLCVLRGRHIEVRQPARVIQGPCQGIAPDAALLVETPNGLERLYGGTVQFPHPLAEVRADGPSQALKGRPHKSPGHRRG